ncbi:hypothetical protein [Pseudanabaena sp. FACHB-2040]|uniref:hypothetical protein n=1 Tax=Pseudanabaena sp. FACHB-2040 TaxID=2692859 RepID=UPI001684376B|nr:hypothetical protein [Pseudanabaena sp. FACHB-2040]MBD2259773.1 hypothetical protein [Pseudanabaena sp. FACHB-2040]
MASSSRSFQSQTINRLLGTYHGWAQRAERVVRRLQVGAAWALQVTLYPVYVGFQAGRLIYRKIAAADPVGQLSRLRQRQPALHRAWIEPNQSDGPIKILLGWLQQPSSPLFEGYLPPAPLKGLVLAAGQALDLSSSRLAKVSQRTRIQGIATQLEDRSLVLVAAGNQLLNLLSIEEQAALSRAIAWLLAEQGHYHWRQQQRLQAGRLPLPSLNRRSWWPVQLFHHLMRWMMMGPVATMTDLFGEAEMVQHQRALRLLQSQNQARSHIQPLVMTETAFVETVPLLPAADPVLTLPAMGRQGALELKQGSSIVSSEGNPDGEVTVVSDRLITTASETHPIWIEAKAVVVDYVDHPLVYLLRWIDKGLLWLESSAGQVWSWLRSHFTL